MNGVIVIDKPDGWTSHDVVAKLRGILHEKRIGHGGTLDPMATGVLPVFVGRATRAVQFCESADKTYIAGLRLGIVTDTQDTTGTVLETRDASCVTEAQLQNVLQNFMGAQKQVPPMYSAVKVGGKKLYELARKGTEIQREARDITVHEITLLERTGDDWILRITCSKGTYVRTLCHDIGSALGCGGAMCSLRRIRAGGFTEAGAITLEQVAKAAEEGRLSKIAMPVDQLFAEYPEYRATVKQEKVCRNGGTFSISSVKDGTYRVYSQSGAFLMLGECRDGVMKTVKSFFEVES